jgi:hypothetical protein
MPTDPGRVHCLVRTILGSSNPRRVGQPIAGLLEELVLPNSFYRHLEAKLDLSFV